MSIDHPDDKDDTGSHPLAGKVDALLTKHQTPAPVIDRNIPVLTDLVEAPEWGAEGAEGAEGEHTLGESASDANSKDSGEARRDPLRQLSESEIDSLSSDIFARVSQRIDAELATSLEARLAEQLQSQLNIVLVHVLDDMKQSIANEIGDAINAALADRLRR
jgi:hypothetical protein